MCKNLLPLPFPKEIQILICQYNAEHREKFYWALRDIGNPIYCQTCNKLIKKYIYSNRNDNEECCSELCLESICNVSIFPEGTQVRYWFYGTESKYIKLTSSVRQVWFNDGELKYIQSRESYEYTNY